MKKESHLTVGKTINGEFVIRFGKDLAIPYKDENGRKFIRVVIPENIKKRRASFLLPREIVHDSLYSDGYWAKLSIDESITIVIESLDKVSPNKSPIWQEVKKRVFTNKEFTKKIASLNDMTNQVSSSPGPRRKQK